MLISRKINISFSLYTIIKREIANCALTNPLFLNNFIKSLVFKLLSQIVIILKPKNLHFKTHFKLTIVNESKLCYKKPKHQKQKRNQPLKVKV